MRRTNYTIPSKIVIRKIPIRKLFLFYFSIKIKYEKLIRSIIQISNFHFYISYNNLCKLNSLSLTIIIQVNRQMQLQIFNEQSHNLFPPIFITRSH